MTPKKSAELFERVGSMAPSKSSLGRLPKVVEERWEGNREAFEAALRDGLQIPEGPVSIAVSLDGVLAPIDGANSPTDVRAKAASEGAPEDGSSSVRRPTKGAAEPASPSARSASTRTWATGASGSRSKRRERAS